MSPKLQLPYLPDYWTKILPWALVIALSVIIYSQHKKIYAPVPPPPEDHRIDSLRHVAEQLNADLLDARHDYDSIQKNTKKDIITIREQNAKDITNIRNFTTKQLDSAWTAIPFP